MKNQLIDLNNHLFAQLERLSEENISSDQLQREIDRSKAISSISKDVISNARLALDAAEFKKEYGMRDNNDLPKMIES